MNGNKWGKGELRIRWFDELSVFSEIVNALFLEGNIHDIYPPNFENLPQTLFDFLQKKNMIV